MKLIVGLGNPGKEYAKTRHNVGFMVADEIISQKCKLKFKSEKRAPAAICWLDKDVLIVKPETFMNNSGKAVKFLTSSFSLPTSNLWVIHDDLDLELGRIKIHRGGSSGHHGIESIIKEIGTDDFVKFRVGIGRPEETSDKSCYYQTTKDFLLAPFKKDELPVIKKAIQKTAEAVMKGLISLSEN